MNNFARERNVAGYNDNGKASYRNALRNQANFKSQLAVATAGDDAEAEEEKATTQGGAVQGAFKTYDSGAKVVKKLRSTKLAGQLEAKADKALQAKFGDKWQEAKRLGAKATDAIGSTMSKGQALVQTGQKAVADAKGAVKGATGALADAKGAVQGAVKAGSGVAKDASKALVKAGTQAVSSGTQAVGSAVQGGIQKGMNDVQTSAQKLLNQGADGRSLSALSGGKADAMNALSQIKPNVGKPNIPNPHAGGIGGADDDGSGLQTPRSLNQSGGGAGKPVDTSTPNNTEGFNPKDPTVSGTGANTDITIGGVSGDSPLNGTQATKEVGAMDSVLGVAGDVMDFLGPIGDLIGIGLSIFGGVEGAKAQDEKKQAVAKAQTQANTNIPTAPVAKSVGATLDTGKQQFQGPSHF